eukprot:TRINITY_DN18809_c0_g1_i1.p1 TRINITY_DN18809_c0_g1~~TRINITY_DN18809_c0_g1_i1.p1  ORF type:complete len:308 (+),score=39.07 TRINITY_DN18809_c0_g1_i1:68-991(+)
MATAMAIAETLCCSLRLVPHQHQGVNQAQQHLAGSFSVAWGDRCYSGTSTSSRKLTARMRSRPTSVSASVRGSLSVSDCVSSAGSALVALALSAALQLSGLDAPVAKASEFNVLNEGPPSTYIFDDAGVLNRVTKTDLRNLLTDLEERKGYHINIVTLRKLTSKPDAFEFADQVLEKWYPTLEEGDNKGLVVLVTTQKEGAVTGGPGFISAVGEPALEGVVSENLPVLATDEKYNEALYSSAKRLVAAIDGQPDIPGPTFQENKRESNFKTKEETEEKRGQFTTVVGGLLVIAFIVPMAQYYAYVKK